MDTSEHRQNEIEQAIEIVRDPAGTSNDLIEYERAARLLADVAERAIELRDDTEPKGERLPGPAYRLMCRILGEASP